MIRFCDIAWAQGTDYRGDGGRVPRSEKKIGGDIPQIRE